MSMPTAIRITSPRMDQGPLTASADQSDATPNQAEIAVAHQRLEAFFQDAERNQRIGALLYLWGETALDELDGLGDIEPATQAIDTITGKTADNQQDADYLSARLEVAVELTYQFIDRVDFDGNRRQSLVVMLNAQKDSFDATGNQVRTILKKSLVLTSASEAPVSLEEPQIDFMPQSLMLQSRHEQTTIAQQTIEPSACVQSAIGQSAAVNANQLSPRVASQVAASNDSALEITSEKSGKPQKAGSASRDGSSVMRPLRSLQWFGHCILSDLRSAARGIQWAGKAIVKGSKAVFKTLAAAGGALAPVARAAGTAIVKALEKAGNWITSLKGVARM